MVCARYARWRWTFGCWSLSCCDVIVPDGKVEIRCERFVVVVDVSLGNVFDVNSSAMRRTCIGGDSERATRCYIGS